jgi:hypothetical protein
MGLYESKCKDDSENNYEGNQTAKMIATLIVLSFYLWALLLALKVSDKESRVLHVTLALLTGPLYVLSYYLGMMENMDGMMMGSPGRMSSARMSM